MYQVFGLTKGDCDAADAHTDREVLIVEDLIATQALRLCPKCFMAQLKLRAKGRKQTQDGTGEPLAQP